MERDKTRQSRTKRDNSKTNKSSSEEQFLSGACIYKIFPKIVAQRHSRGLRNRTQGHNTRTEEELATILQSLKNYYMSDNIHQCRTVIGSLNQKLITSLHNIVMNELTTSKRLERSCLLMLKDL